MPQSPSREAWNLEQRSQQLKRRHKTCLYCKVEYCDVTKRFVGKTCSQECASKLMTEKRHRRGTYKRTEIQNQRMAATFVALRAEGKCQMTDAGKARIRIANQKAHREGKIKAGFQKKYGVDHWTQTDRGREMTSKLHSGKTISPEHRKAVSQAAKLRLQSENQYSRCKKGKRSDLEGVYFRSAWEANYARILNYLSMAWEFEPETFDVGESETYTPDFKLADGSFVEIKGWWTEIGKRKVELFRQRYPQMKLQIIGRPEYTALYKQYGSIITHWEKT